MNRFRLFLLCMGAFCLGACHASKKLVTTTPSSPLQVADSLPPLPGSEIDLPFAICIRPVLAVADSLVPREFTSDAWPAYTQPSCDFRYKYRFVRSGFALSCTNSRITVQLSGSYQVAGGKCLCTYNKPVSPWVSGTCGFGSEPMRRVNIEIGSRVDFLPGYRIHTLTRLTKLQPLDKCIVSMFSADMTQQVVDSVHSSIDAFCTLMDRTVAGMDFSPWIRQATRIAWQGISIGRYGYMTVNPTQVRVSSLNAARDTLFFSLGISCKPQLSSDSIKARSLPPLPPLITSSARDGFALYLPATYTYTFISKLLNDSLRGKTFLVKGNKLTIKDIDMKGIGKHQVEMKIDFAGDRRGEIVLRGTPVLDTARQTLTIPDISYTLESKDLALRIAKA